MAASVADPESPQKPGTDVLPLPAKVVMMPLVSTLRTRLFSESAMYRLPAESNARPLGAFSFALTAGPPSPEKPARELPATKVMEPEASILKTELPLLKYRLPPENTSFRGWPIDVFRAA